MKISKNSAMQIITEISQIIDQHVNMMDYNGYIIASTNKKRVGVLHEGAKRVIDEALPELVVYRDGEYKGAQKGINLPLIFRERCVGVIGITGEKDEVEKYGQIIKKMTEILMLDAYSNEQKLLDKRLKKRFIEDWIFANPTNINQELIDRGLLLGVDITIPRRVIVGKLMVIDPDQEARQLEYAEQAVNQVEKTIEKIVLQDHYKNIFLRIGSKMIALIVQQTDQEMASLGNRLREVVFNDYGFKLGVGIDNDIGEYKAIHTSYINAEKALSACLSSKNYEISFYDDINIEIFISEIPKHLKQEFIQKIFKNCQPEEIEHFIQIIEVLFEADGSINKAADKLFMHKNTLQNRLQLIAKKTNYDPRQLKNAALFYMAIYFHYEINNF